MKRYKVFCIESDDGDYVRYSDHAAALAERDAEIDALNAKIYEGAEAAFEMGNIHRTDRDEIERLKAR